MQVLEHIPFVGSRLFSAKTKLTMLKYLGRLKRKNFSAEREVKVRWWFYFFILFKWEVSWLRIRLRDICKKAKVSMCSIQVREYYCAFVRRDQISPLCLTHNMLGVGEWDSGGIPKSLKRTEKCEKRGKIGDSKHGVPSERRSTRRKPQTSKPGMQSGAGRTGHEPVLKPWGGRGWMERAAEIEREHGDRENMEKMCVLCGSHSTR